MLLRSLLVQCNMFERAKSVLYLYILRSCVNFYYVHYSSQRRPFFFQNINTLKVEPIKFQLFSIKIVGSFIFKCFT